MNSLLRFRRVALRRGGRLLFEGMDLELGRGQALQIAGPNGSGKSSLIRLAAGLLQPESGAVESAPAALADDNPALDGELPLSRALRFWGGDAESAMRSLSLHHVAQVPVRLLSAGQIKRATLARVVGSHAPLWLLDEPLNALDAEGARQLAGVIAQHRASGGAVVAASHQSLPGEWTMLELGR